MKRRQVFRAQASKSQTGSSSRRFANSGPVLPFNPASIPGCQLWLDAADSSSVAINSSSNVLAWIDKSNTGTTATPTRGSTGNPINYVTVDTYPAVYINNNNSVLYNSSTYSQLTVQSNFQTTRDYSIFAVVNLSNTTVSGVPELQTIYANERVSGGETRSPNFGAGITIEYISDGTARGISSSFIGTGRLQTSLTSSTSDLTAYKNGTVYASVTSSLTGTSSDSGALPMIGGTYGALNGGQSDNRFATGYFHELLVYNSLLTTIQRQKVEGYLAHKWGLQSSLPSNHPHKTTAPTYEEPVFVPTLISGSQLWLDGNDPIGTGTQPANGATVSTWVDKSGNGRNATPTGTGPTYTTNIFNGYSAPVFNGTTMVTPSYLITTDSKISIFVLCKKTGLRQAGANSDILNIAAGYQYFSLYIRTALTNYLEVFYQNTPNGLTNYAINDGTNLLVSILTNGLSIDGYLSGTSVVSSTPNNGYSMNNLTSQWRISPDQFVGPICEIIIFNSTFTTSQRQRVEGYLAQKWGLQSSLPASHPYKTIAPTGIPRSITSQSLSVLFNSGSLSVPANAALTLGTNNHTFEFWLYQTSRNFYDVPFIYGNTAGNATNNYYMNLGQYTGVLIGNGSPGGWSLNMANGVSLPALNTWSHYALVRNGNTFTLYLNGTNVASATLSISIPAQGGVMAIGGLNSGGNTISGYMANFRFVNGTAVYTSNFTPPTSPLTAIPNTQVLIQGLVDRSPNAFTVTNNGGVTLSTSVSPFV